MPTMRTECSHIPEMRLLGAARISDRVERYGDSKDARQRHPSGSVSWRDWESDRDLRLYCNRRNSWLIGREEDFSDRSRGQRLQRRWQLSGGAVRRSLKSGQGMDLSKSQTLGAQLLAGTR